VDLNYETVYHLPALHDNSLTEHFLTQTENSHNDKHHLAPLWTNAPQ